MAATNKSLPQMNMSLLALSKKCQIVPLPVEIGAAGAIG
jgi:hypothetical protein